MNNTQKSQKSVYEQHEIALSAHTGAFVNLLMRQGYLEDPAISNEAIRKAKQEKTKNAYHNTKLLLRSYRDIQWLLQCLPTRIAGELDAPLEDLDALISSVNRNLEFEDHKLQERMKSIEQSRLLLDRVNEALTVLREKPKNGDLLYDIIYQTYITRKWMKREEVLENLHISTRHYYRLRQQAISILSLRLWAAPDKSLDSWLEVMSLVEAMQSGDPT